MSVFVDTSAFYALLVQDEAGHEGVAKHWRESTQSGTSLVTSNYVLVETHALLQSRFGMDAVRDFQRSLVPLVNVRWIDAGVHRQAVERLLKTDHRKLSLVDVTSFLLMDQEGIRTALALDPDFAENGYEVVPGA